MAARGTLRPGLFSVIVLAQLVGAGCAYVSDADYRDRLDFDDDGHDDAAFGGDDCDDAEAAVHPGADESCNDVDDDCDGVIDPSTSTDALEWYSDADGDGWGSGAAVRGCRALFSAAPQGGDCNPIDPAVNPGVAEVWYDGADQDCAGDSDWDQDGDGHDALAGGGDDCDDVDAGVLPGATETWYDDVDQDCAGDDDWDQDQDGWRADEGDCEDTDPDVNPDATETWYDGVDQDCAGDDDQDRDADGVGVDADCDDADPSVHPAAQELCDAADVDEDCDGAADDDDDDASGTTASYLDADGDGYGDPATETATCGDDASRVADGRDCDDADAGVNPPSGDCTNVLSEDDAGLAVIGSGPDDHVGAAVCTGGDLDGDGGVDLVVGAWGADATAADNVGAVFLVGAAETGEVDLGGRFALWGTEAAGSIGAALLCADLDGDGADDLVVGGGTTDTLWRMAGPIGAADTLADAEGIYGGDVGGTDAGFAIDAADVDGDGVVELLVGGPLAADEGGAAWLVDGDAIGTIDLAGADLVITGADAGAWGGWSVALVGDMDGDGMGEVAVGAPFTDTGSVWIFAGDRTGAFSSEDADASFVGLESGETAGLALADAGDTDGDGLADLLVGSPYATSGGHGYAGQVVLLSGALPVGADATSAVATLLGDAAGQEVGVSLTAGDIDGDGVPDLVVGGSGAAWVFLSPVTGTREVAEAEARVDGSAGAAFGTAVAATDLDGDGRADLVVGGPLATTSAGQTGAAWLFGAEDLLP